MSVTPLQQITVVQMGHVEKIAETAQNQPQVQQQVSQETAKSELKNQSGQVPTVEKGPALDKLRTGRDGQKQRQPDPHNASKEKKNSESPEQPSDDEAPPRGDNPWAGHILNLKV